jgi:hypothetical protein
MENSDEPTESEGLLEEWGQTMYPDICWQESNRLVGRGGSILVKRKFEGQETFSHLKVSL